MRGLAPVLLLVACAAGVAAPPPATSRRSEEAPPERLEVASPDDAALEQARAGLASHTLHRVPVGRAPVRGPADAPVTLVVFSDFECPYCARGVTILEAVRARYGQQLRIAFRHLPLGYHRLARGAHRAAEEARAQGGDDAFWSMHDRIFAVRDLSPDRLEAHARAMGLDLDEFRAAIRDRRHDPAIDADRALGERLGVRGTPGFFLNGRSIRGAKPPEDFAVLIDALLIEAQARLAAGTPASGLYDALTADGVTAVEPPSAAPSRVEPPPVPVHAPRRGASSPELVVQIFSDFECPYCERLVPLLRRIESDFPEVQIVWRHFPLSQHPGGRLASEVGAAVRADAGDAAFWRFHDALFAAGRPLDRAKILQVAGAIEGVDGAAVERAVRANAHTLEIAGDLEAGRRAGVRSTPTLLVGGRVVRGAGDYLALEEILDAELGG